MYELNFILKKIDFKKYNTELDIIKMEKYNSEDDNFSPSEEEEEEEVEVVVVEKPKKKIKKQPNFKEIIAARSKEITKINHARFKEEFPEEDEITKGLEEYAKQHPEADIGKFN